MTYKDFEKKVLDIRSLPNTSKEYLENKIKKLYLDFVNEVYYEIENSTGTKEADFILKQITT